MFNSDVYEYITNFADDRTIIDMLSVNKKFNGEVYFRRILRRKYPLLLNFQKRGETDKRLFIRMTYYIANLGDIPYIPFRDRF